MRDQYILTHTGLNLGPRSGTTVHLPSEEGRLREVLHNSIYFLPPSTFRPLSQNGLPVGVEDGNLQYSFTAPDPRPIKRKPSR